MHIMRKNKCLLLQTTKILEIIFITVFLKDTDSEEHTYSQQKVTRQTTNPKAKPDLTGKWDPEISCTWLREALILIH